jgi:hypothetical protein
MWWIRIALLIEAVGLLLVAGLLLTAAPKSEKELCYEEEAQVRALAIWRANGCRGWVATESSKQSQDIGQLVDADPAPPGGPPRRDFTPVAGSIIT